MKMITKANVGSKSMSWSMEELWSGSWTGSWTMAWIRATYWSWNE